MALAHQISLIDLSGPSFKGLRDLLDEIAEIVLKDMEITKNIDSIILKQILREPKKSIILLLRLYLREILGTWPLSQKNPLTRFESEQLEIKLPSVWRIKDSILNFMKNYNEFFVGMANGPFLLIFKANDPEGFLRYANENPTHNITIHWTKKNNQYQWEIHPVYGREVYSLVFGLPKTLGDWIFGNDVGILNRALDVKERFFSDITIYRYFNGMDQLFRLKYDAKATKRRVLYRQDHHEMLGQSDIKYS